MVLKNMTPHDVVIVDADGNVIKTFPSDGLVRLSATTADAGEVDGVRLTRTVFGEPEGLPEAVAGTWLIVSQLVKAALPGRSDLVVPAEVVRDGNGRIVGCQSLGI